MIDRLEWVEKRNLKLMRTKPFVDRVPRVLALAFTLAGMSLVAQGGVILLVNSGTTTDSVSQPVGESFTTPGGGPWNNIVFNFFSDVPATTPLAAGNAFLLTQEYLGDPASLSSSTAGFLAESVSVSGGQYIFDPSLLLDPNTEYWLYEDADLQTTGSGTGGSAAGQAYFAGSGSFSTLAGNELANYELDGTVVPEPATWLTGLGGALLLGLLKVRSRNSARQGKS